MSSTNESNTTGDNRVVHISANGKRFYYVDNDEKKDRRYFCTGKDDTCVNLAQRVGLCYSCGATRPLCKGFTKEGRRCPNQAKKGGLCNGCGAPRPLCQAVIEGGGTCPNFSQRGGFCKTHNPNPRICTGVNDDDSHCTNRAVTGDLCEKHKDGGRYSMCPCGRQRQTCRNCEPLGNLVKRIRGALNRATRKYIKGKPLGDPPEWLGCTWEDFFVWIYNLFEAGMTWDNYGKGKGKWNFDHEHAFFDKEDPAKTEDEIFRRAHYTNVRPMWCEKNRSKGNR